MDQLGLMIKTVSAKEDSLYKTGLTQIHAGQWQQAFESFQTLQESYPDDPDVKKWLQEIRMRTALTQDRSRSWTTGKRRFGAGGLLTAIVALVILTVAGYVAYVLWIDPIFIHELRVRQVTELRRSADEATAAGDYEQARQSLQQLQALLPEDPETLEALNQIEQVETLALLYQEAKALMSAGTWDQAIELLTELQDIDAQYRDLPQLLEEAKASLTLDKQFQAAEESFYKGDWKDAIAKYQAIQQTDITFRFDDVQAKIFESHLKFGQAILFEAADDPGQVADGLIHFSEALKLRPLDHEALQERRLGETYLAALSSEDSDEVIMHLQIIYEQQPDYANRAAAQLLYDALLRQGASLQAAGKPEAAADAYQAAAQLLVEDASEAQAKLVELTENPVP